ncbi:hypothetical protein BDV93DRAFT_315489 [Ceratobasidium sp. AG-I]|nr:hypothetical protein BDV93DRAFT_315489 [Ceratobasidium sp. AG-I]
MSTRKPLPPPPRPSLKRSLTSIMTTITRKPSRTPRRVSSWDPTWQSQASTTRRVRIAPEPHPWASRPPRFDIVESGGLALVNAQDAFTDSRRAVWTRIVWSLPVELDTGARALLGRVGERDVAEELAKLGVKRYLETGRGAIFCNAGYDSGSSRKLAVDWVTFRDTQKTRDKWLQQDVLSNDPATSVLVYVFRLAPDKKSLAIWRKRIPLSVSVSGPNSAAIAAQKRKLADAEQLYFIKISPAKEELSRAASLRRWASFSRRAVDA